MSKKVGENKMEKIIPTSFEKWVFKNPVLNLILAFVFIIITGSLISKFMYMVISVLFNFDNRFSEIIITGSISFILSVFIGSYSFQFIDNTIDKVRMWKLNSYK